jgi:F-type H+-transporting ATPase subunit beta
MNKRSEVGTSNEGTVLSVRGSVIDAYFPNRIPSLNNILRGGKDKDIVIEVLTHLDSKTVRGIALTSTQGLVQCVWGDDR